MRSREAQPCRIGRKPHGSAGRAVAGGPQGVALVLASLLLTACATTAAGPSGPSFMSSGEPVEPPSGFSDLCRREPLNCQSVRPGAQRQNAVALTADRRALLEDVNRSVNRQILDARDVDLYGEEEFWVNPLRAGRTRAGDCEDYALAKRDLLIARGWPKESLFLAVGHHQRLGLHAVLIVRTSEGDLVLDARSPWLQRFDEAPYVWVKRQLASHSLDWVRPYQSLASPGEATGATATTARPAGSPHLKSR